MALLAAMGEALRRRILAAGVRDVLHELERVCCLLVLDSVTSTPQWIRQPKPRDVVQDVCVLVCECV